MSCAVCGLTEHEHLGLGDHVYTETAAAYEQTELMVKLRNQPSAYAGADEPVKTRRRICVGGQPVMEQNKWGGWDVIKYYTMSVDDMRKLREALDHALALEEIDCKTVTVSTIEED